MPDGELTPQEEAEKLIKRARIKAREIETKIEEAGGAYSALVYDAYNAMFMAARAALHYLDIPSSSHRTVASHYKHDIVEKGLIPSKFADHLQKIMVYWEEEQQGTKHEIDEARARRISEATKEVVDELAVVAGVKVPGHGAGSGIDRRLYTGQ